jgi:hypothetical protein
MLHVIINNTRYDLADDSDPETLTEARIRAAQVAMLAANVLDTPILLEVVAHNEIEQSMIRHGRSPKCWTAVRSGVAMTVQAPARISGQQKASRASITFSTTRSGKKRRSLTLTPTWRNAF